MNSCQVLSEKGAYIRRFLLGMWFHNSEYLSCIYAIIMCETFSIYTHLNTDEYFLNNLDDWEFLNKYKLWLKNIYQNKCQNEKHCDAFSS